MAFDENRYNRLLHDLIHATFLDELPLIRIDTAPIWGVSKARKFAVELARDYDRYYPKGNYSAATKTIDLRITDDIGQANRMLLSTTRQWAGDLNGELAASQQADHDRRFLRRGIVLGPAAVGAAAGAEAMGGDGAIIGGVAGFAIGAVAEIVDMRRRPYWRSVRQFAENPEIVAEYGQVISLEAA